MISRAVSATDCNCAIGTLTAFSASACVSPAAIRVLMLSGFPFSTASTRWACRSLCNLATAAACSCQVKSFRLRFSSNSASSASRSVRSPRLVNGICPSGTSWLSQRKLPPSSQIWAIAFIRRSPATSVQVPASSRRTGGCSSPRSSILVTKSCSALGSNSWRWRSGLMRTWEMGTKRMGVYSLVWLRKNGRGNAEIRGGTRENRWENGGLMQPYTDAK